MSNIKMMILIQGSDSYKQKREVDAIINKRKNSKISFFDFHLKSTDLSQLMDEAKQDSLFKEEKTLFIYGLLERGDLSEKKIETLNSLKDKTMFVFIENKLVSKKDPFLKHIKRTIEVSSIKNSLELEKWIESEFLLRDSKIEPLAVKLLAKAAGNDLWSLSNEIDKITTYKMGNLVTSEDVVSFVKPKVDITIFPAIDAMAERDRKKALRLIYARIEAGDSISYILSMISFQFRNLNLVKNDKGSASELEMHPFVYRKTLSQVKKFSTEELKRIYLKIALVDSKIKRGQLDNEAALSSIIFEL